MAKKHFLHYTGFLHHMADVGVIGGDDERMAGNARAGCFVNLLKWCHLNIVVQFLKDVAISSFLVWAERDVIELLGEILTDVVGDQNTWFTHVGHDGDGKVLTGNGDCLVSTSILRGAAEDIQTLLIPIAKNMFLEIFQQFLIEKCKYCWRVS